MKKLQIAFISLFMALFTAMAFISLPTDSYAATAQNPKWIKITIKRWYVDTQKQAIVFVINHKNNSESKVITKLFNISFQYSLKREPYNGVSFNYKLNKYTATTPNKVEIYPGQTLGIVYTVKVGDKLWKQIMKHRKDGHFKDNDKRIKIMGSGQAYKFTAAYYDL